MNRRVALLSVVLGGCTFGGSDEDPTNGLLPVVELDGGESAMESDAGSSRMDAALASDARVMSDAASSDGGRRDGGSSDAGGGSCKPSKALAACDPVKNTGCDFLTQCDLNPDGMTQAGRCVLWTIGLLGCSSNALSTTCEGTNACIDSACQKLCYCDSDCTMGKKCTGTVPGPMGPVKYCK